MTAPGADRFHRARARGARDHWLSGDDAQNDERAFTAELWLARRYGLPQTLLRDDRPDPGFDFELTLARHRSLTIDVKSSKHATAGLAMPAHRPLRAQLYVLVTGELELTVRGFAWAGRLRAAPIKNLGFADCHYLAQSELHSAAAFAAQLALYGFTDA